MMPQVGERFQVYDSIVTVVYAQHGCVVLSRGGKYNVQMTPEEFWRWLELKHAVRV